MSKRSRNHTTFFFICLLLAPALACNVVQNRPAVTVSPPTPQFWQLPTDTILPTLALETPKPGSQVPATPTQAGELTLEPVQTAGTPPVPAATATPGMPPTTPAAEGMALFNNEAIQVSYSVKLAQSVRAELVPAVFASGGPYWEAAPQHWEFTLEDYPLSNTFHTPRLYLYPIAEFQQMNPAAAQTIAGLRTLMKHKTTGMGELPFLPLFNAAQVFHAQVQYFSFQNGSGVRFLTQFDQAPLPINNHELFYTFQGLTNDSRYYLAAILPVHLATLPADEQVTGQEPANFAHNFPAYLEEVTGQINVAASESFSPALSDLDQLIQSITVR